MILLDYIGYDYYIDKIKNDRIFRRPFYLNYLKYIRRNLKKIVQIVHMSKYHYRMVSCVLGERKNQVHLCCDVFFRKYDKYNCIESTFC